MLPVWSEMQYCPDRKSKTGDGIPTSIDADEPEIVDYLAKTYGSEQNK